MLKKLFIGLSLLISLSTFADQCAYISEDAAIEALELVQLSKEVHHFCEPCGDEIPVLININTAEVRDVNYQGCWGLYLNNKIQDLAYTYIEGMNLSKLLGLTSYNVSDEIDY